LEEFSKDLTIGDVEESIIGSWASIERDGYLVEFSSTGEMTESLESNQTIGTWDIVSFEEGPNKVIGTIAFSKKGVFLKQSLDAGRANFYYKVVRADAEGLILIYLHQGGVLSFNRVK
jgi:hypothetical protein